MERRDFLKASAIGAAGIMLPAGMMRAASAPAPAAAKKPANDKVNLGFIGLGQQVLMLLDLFLPMEDVRVVAGCDVYDIKRERFVHRVTQHYTTLGEKKVKVDVYEDYQDLLARPDIDAVVIAVPDHQHAVIGIAACKAGKDIFIEKPLTLTVYEGQQLVKAVRKYNRIVQVGSMQRSSNEFIHAANMVREGELGTIRKIKTFLGRDRTNPDTPGPVKYDLPEMPVPAGLNWDKWLGPLPTSFHYHEELNPLNTLEQRERFWARWRFFKGLGNGNTADWGAHMFDFIQWAVGKDRSGPVEIIPPGYSFYDHLTYKYDNGIIVSEEPCETRGQGVEIYGDEGWIKVSRNRYTCSDKRLEMTGPMTDNNVSYYANDKHYRAFIDAVKSRNDPNTPIEVGHSSCTFCILGNIAMELGRPIVWNPIVEKFRNDPEATKLLHYDYRPGYSLDV